MKGLFMNVTQATIGAIVITLLGIAANAETYHCLNGKEVSAGEATRASLSNSKASIIKVQVSKVSLNEETMRLKKVDDVKLSNPCNLK